MENKLQGDRLNKIISSKWWIAAIGATGLATLVGFYQLVLGEYNNQVTASTLHPIEDYSKGGLAGEIGRSEASGALSSNARSLKHCLEALNNDDNISSETRKKAADLLQSLIYLTEKKAENLGDVVNKFVNSNLGTKLPPKEFSKKFEEVLHTEYKDLIRKGNGPLNLPEIWMHNFNRLHNNAKNTNATPSNKVSCVIDSVNCNFTPARACG